MSLKPATREAFELLMRGSEAMARIEQAGLRIDVDYLDKSIKDVTVRVAEMEQAIRDDKAYKVWEKTFGNSMKLGSRQQLGHVIFDQMGYKRNPFMGGSNDVAAFEHLKQPFVRNWQDVERLKKALATNLLGLRKEVIDGYIHAFFDLHTTESYRSSSSRPNLQNQPIRNKDISRIVRTCVIPREDHVFLEPDLETHEVRISYCYNKDPKLKYDILHGDMHYDRAKDLFLLTDEEIGDKTKQPGKNIRFVGKNDYVFAQFYGSYFAQCAPDLWDDIAILDLRTTQGISLYEHLASKGIKKLGACDPDKEPIKGTFEYHVREIDRKMWESDYIVYNQWKKNWWAEYQQNGGINTKTGFKLEGIFRRNQILCDPIQGSAFHCLLWAIIQIERELRKRKMRSRIVVQIHDSVLIDTHKSEIEDVVKIVSDIVLRKLPKHWPWICIPLGMGFDVCSKNWFDKKPLQLEGMPV